MSIGLFAFLLQTVPAAPVAPPPYPPVGGIRLDCKLQAPGSGEEIAFSATILAEDRNSTPTSGERSRTIDITGGPRPLLGKHLYGWSAWRGTYHTVQIQDYADHTDYLLTLQIPKSDQLAGAMLYRWHGTDTVSIGYCTHGSAA